MYRSPDQIRLGQEVHQVETQIYIGKEAVKATIASKPVDVDMLQAQRAAVHGARIDRNVALDELAKTKLYALPAQHWTMAG